LSDISVWLVAPSLLIFAPIKKGAAAGLLKIAWKIPLSTILPHQGGGESQANHLKERKREDNLYVLLPWWEEVRRRGNFIILRSPEAPREMIIIIRVI
jgi:hypothetical protein